MVFTYLTYLTYIPVIIACFNIGPLNILNYIARFFGVVLYTLNDEHNQEEIKNILKNIKNEVYTTGYTLRNGNPRLSGFFFTWYCFGLYDEYKLWIYISEYRFNTISKNNTLEYTINRVDDIATESTSKPKCESIKVYNYNNSYMYSAFHVRNLNVSNIHPNEEQHELVENIHKLYKKRGRASIWIEGIPGSGKSTIGLLLAKKIHAAYCHTFNPLIPSMNLNQLYADNDDMDIPIVIVIEEYDKIIKTIHEDKVIRNERYHTMVYDKGSLNTFMDDLYLYPNTIFIFTSNTQKSEIDVLDTSYLRPGRFHGYFTMKNIYSIE
jgi:hypothetical protein